jgi:hypothetical protein
VELWLKAAGDDEVEMWGKTSAQILEECDRWLATQEDRAWNVFGRFAGVVRSP